MKKNKLFLILLFIMSGFFLASCKNESQEEIDILTQKPLSENKINITVMVKYAFSINKFEEAIEKKFPNLNIIQVGNYSRDMGIDEYYARIKNDDLTDIVMTWPLDTGKEYWKDRLLDLSTLPVTKNYTTKSLNEVSSNQDGKLYYLPGPSQVRGIVYNKTLFKENGWEVPSDLQTFIQLCQTIEQSGMRSLQLGLKNSEVLDTAFVGYSYGECFANPTNVMELAKFNQGLRSFTDNFAPALSTFERFIEAGILKKEDLAIDYADREKMFFTRKCAMLEDSVLLSRMGESITGTKDEFALMPFFNEGDYNDWARLYPVCFIGVNKHLSEEKNAEKYAMVLKILDYISTPEGQLSLAGDTGAMFSNLKGMFAPEVDEIKDMTVALNAGRYGVFPTLKNAQEALRRGLTGMILGTHTISDVIKMVDEQNANPPIPNPPKEIGQASSDFTMIETGNFFTDVMREYGNSDFALFMDNGKDGLYNGKGLSGRFYEGSITSADILRVLPDLKNNEVGELLRVSVTGENLLKILEYSIPVDNNKGGWFYYFSGLIIEFDPCAAPGSRIKKITDSQKRPIEMNKIYTISVMDETIPQEYIISNTKINVLIQDIVQQKIIDLQTISPSRDNRFIIV